MEHVNIDGLELEYKPVKPKLYLSRRNLLTLLSKLDRKAAGEATACALIKQQQPSGTPFQQTMQAIQVIAVDDNEYYGAQQREAGIGRHRAPQGRAQR